MSSLSRAQAILSIETRAAILKEWLDTERGKKADVMEKQLYFPESVPFIPYIEES